MQISEHRCERMRAIKVGAAICTDDLHAGLLFDTSGSMAAEISAREKRVVEMSELGF